MSTLDDHVHEMPSPALDDRALGALRNGSRSAPAGFDWLVPFVEDLREAASQPAPVVRQALARLLAEGFSTKPAPFVHGVPARRTKVVARVALGFGLALAGTTAAGAAGVLPDPAQRAVATVVQAATPFSFPDTADDRAGFGATVSTDATGASDGRRGVAGTAVSDAARNRAPAEPAATAPTGLDRANQTPAAGRVPTSVPVATAPAVAGGPPAGAGSPASNGLDRAAETPASTHVPPAVPAVTRPGPADQGGRPRSDAPPADETPAADRPSATAPGRR